MKNYLLRPNKRLEIADGRFFVIKRSQNDETILQSLWKFVKDKYFLCIHLQYDENLFVKSFERKDESKTMVEEVKDFVVNSDICLGFLPKKGNASVKSMLKVYKLEDCYTNHMQDSSFLENRINCEGASLSGINTIAYLGRLELYVSEYHWLKATTKQ